MATKRSTRPAGTSHQAPGEPWPVGATVAPAGNTAQTSPDDVLPLDRVEARCHRLTPHSLGVLFAVRAP
jgi:hypothetical protein